MSDESSPKMTPALAVPGASDDTDQDGPSPLPEDSPWDPRPKESRELIFQYPSGAGARVPTPEPPVKRRLRSKSTPTKSQQSDSSPSPKTDDAPITSAVGGSCLKHARREKSPTPGLQAVHFVPGPSQPKPSMVARAMRGFYDSLRRPLSEKEKPKDGYLRHVTSAPSMSELGSIPPPLEFVVHEYRVDMAPGDEQALGAQAAEDESLRLGVANLPSPSMLGSSTSSSRKNPLTKSTSSQRELAGQQSRPSTRGASSHSAGDFGKGRPRHKQNLHRDIPPRQFSSLGRERKTPQSEPRAETDPPGFAVLLALGIEALKVQMPISQMRTRSAQALCSVPSASADSTMRRKRFRESLQDLEPRPPTAASSYSKESATSSKGDAIALSDYTGSDPSGQETGATFDSVEVFRDKQNKTPPPTRQSIGELGIPAADDPSRSVARESEVREWYRRLLGTCGITAATIQQFIKDVETSLQSHIVHPVSCAPCNQIERYVCIFGMNLWLLLRTPSRKDFWFYCGTGTEGEVPIGEPEGVGEAGRASRADVEEKAGEAGQAGNAEGVGESELKRRYTRSSQPATRKCVSRSASGVSSRKKTRKSTSSREDSTTSSPEPSTSSSSGLTFLSSITKKLRKMIGDDRSPHPLEPRPELSTVGVRLIVEVVEKDSNPVAEEPNLNAPDSDNADDESTNGSGPKQLPEKPI